MRNRCPYRIDGDGRYPIDCPEKDRKCSKCGWNPDVEAERIKNLKKSQICPVPKMRVIWYT